MRLKIGKTLTLSILRDSEFGLYLVDDDFNEVLLPNAYVTDEMEIGDEIDVFIYLDSEERQVATTLKPLIELGEFAYLKVKQTTNIGAFIDWGLPKDLLVPFAEQRVDLEEGRSYLFYLLKDEVSDRLIASTKERKFLETENIQLKDGDEVNILCYHFTELGMNAIINNKYKGLIFVSDIHKKIRPGDRTKAYIKKIREDGKIDLVLEPLGFKMNIDKNEKFILNLLKEKDGFLDLNDKSSPEEINNKLGLSKKAFKKTIGGLYRQKLITIEPNGIKINPKPEK